MLGLVRVGLRKEDIAAEAGVRERADIIALHFPFSLIATFLKRCPENSRPNMGPHVRVASDKIWGTHDKTDPPKG